MRLTAPLIALLAASVPANTAATALHGEAIVNSTLPSLHDLNETDSYMDGSRMDSSINGSNMEAGKVDAIVSALSACKDPRSLGCWNEILNVVDGADKKGTKKKTSIFKTIFKHVVNIATIIKTVKDLYG
jgi:hypothetical protein